jgi:hypothetical protein
MKALNDLLREADPLTDDPGLSSAEARVIRRLVVDAASEREAATPFAHQPLAIAGVLTIMIAAGITAGRQLPIERATFSPRSAAPETNDERRQLQFATPGGTRIIWTFDPEFHP